MAIQHSHYFNYERINKEAPFKMDKTKLSSIVLGQLSLEHYIPVFQQANVGFDQFVAMSEKDFVSLGLRNEADLDLLSNCARALKTHISKQLADNTILEENNDRTNEANSVMSNHTHCSNLDQSDDSMTLVGSVSSESILRAIHAYDSYHSSYEHEPPMAPSIQGNTSSGSLVAPPGTVIRRNKPNISNNSHTSRPLSMPVQLPSQKQNITPPPDYTSTIFGRRLDRCRSMIIPREEEGREELPGYSCSVFKMGYVHVKSELDAPNMRSKWRAWRKLYIELWGTVLRVYRAKPVKNQTDIKNYYRWPLKTPYYYYHKYYYTPIFTISLAGAEASRALDYFRRPNVLRLMTQQGPQFLMKLSSHVEMISWVEHLQAAINISLDLEHRPMPKFMSIPTRALISASSDPRTIELERIREQRRRDQRETLI
ncbi:hypothetical protein BD560DRAFT_367971 [Blakeslea trispora]|nr:hypothetical protein BD560DRAFT_367971 [Blakeslea trispora]